MNRDVIATNVAMSFELFHRSIYAIYVKKATDGKADPMTVTTFARESLSHANRFYNSTTKHLDDHIALIAHGLSGDALNRVKTLRETLLLRLDSLTSDAIKHYQQKLRMSALFGDKNGFTDREFDYRVLDIRGRSLDPTDYAKTSARAFAVDVHFLSSVVTLAEQGQQARITYPDVNHRNYGTVFDPKNDEQVKTYASFFHPNSNAMVTKYVVHS